MGHRWMPALAALVLLAACGGGGGGRDSTAPGVTLTQPANLSDGVSGTIPLAATASDNTGVREVEFQVDGATVEIDPTVPYQVAFDTSALPAGQHIVRARARDAANNFSAWASATINVGGTNPRPDGFTRNELFVTGLVDATALAQAPDGRLFIAQQGGAVRIFKQGLLVPQPFVQLTDVDASGERGLIGIALDPNFTVTNHVFLHYTSTTGGAHNRVVRLTARQDTSAGDEFSILELPALGAPVHNGGAIHFGTDGKLYVAVGDNANGPLAQDPSSLFGKLLRLNADGSIPLDNPFVNAPIGDGRKVFASGLRNPFTFAVQPATGRIHINDVGEATWEEINLGVAGANYGWPNSEGPVNVAPGQTGPLFAYNHVPGVPPGSGPGGFFVGQAIAGGAFYPDSGPFPASFRGNYYFADFATGVIGRLDLANGNAAYAFGSVTGSPVDMLVASDGALLVLTRTGVTRFSAP